MISILLPGGLHLRSYKAEDAGLLFRTVEENRAHLSPWLPWVARTTKQEHSQEFIQETRQQQEAGTGLALGIFKDGVHVGAVGLHHQQQEVRRAGLGYWLARHATGQGIATRCAGRLISFAFQRLALNKIELHFIALNTASAAVATRLGARTEGVLREAAIHHGQLYDLVITGILKKEWDESNAAFL